jgi:hypothetical protein
MIDDVMATMIYETLSPLFFPVAGAMFAFALLLIIYRNLRDLLSD